MGILAPPRPWELIAAQPTFLKHPGKLPCLSCLRFGDCFRSPLWPHGLAARAFAVRAFLPPDKRRFPSAVCRLHRYLRLATHGALPKSQLDWFWLLFFFSRPAASLHGNRHVDKRIPEAEYDCFRASEPPQPLAAQVSWAQPQYSLLAGSCHACSVFSLAALAVFCTLPPASDPVLLLPRRAADDSLESFPNGK